MTLDPPIGASSHETLGLLPCEVGTSFGEMSCLPDVSYSVVVACAGADSASIYDEWTVELV